MDAVDTQPQMFLAGDRNMGSGNPPTTLYSATSFKVSVGTNFNATALTTAPGWTDQMHQKQGNVGLADGSVQGFSRSKLQEALKNSGDAGTTAGTYSAAAGGGPAGVNRLQFP